MMVPPPTGGHDLGARQRIIEAAVRTIEDGGEASVRISTVASDALVTQGMISYHFGGREGLIQEAQLTRFLSTVTDDIKILESKARQAQSVEELFTFLIELTAEVVSLGRSSARGTRLMAIAAALSRPRLLALISEAQSTLVDGLEKVVLIAQARDLMRNDLDARAVAVFILSYSTGLIVADIDRQRPTDEQLTAVISGFVEFLVRRP
jgi:AcrR family transcriptional regulator